MISTSNISWFITTHGGALCGNGMEDSLPAGACTGDVITVKADLDKGSVQFYVNGRIHGPGYPEGVQGPLCFAVNTNYIASQIRIVPNPDLEEVGNEDH